MATPNEYMSRAACYACLTDHQLLTLLVRIEADRLLALTPMADVTPQALMARSGCYHCLPDHSLLTLYVRLMVDIYESGGVGGGVTIGDGSPDGVVTAAPGSWYYDRIDRFLYLKTSGAGNTGWALIA